MPGPGPVSLGLMKRLDEGIEYLITLFYNVEELSIEEKPYPCISLKYYLLNYVGTSTLLFVLIFGNLTICVLITISGFNPIFLSSPRLKRVLALSSYPEDARCFKAMYRLAKIDFFFNNSSS